jgi:hypothetical protein
LSKDKEVDGGLIWLFADWKGDRPLLTDDPTNPFVYHMGLVDFDRNERFSFKMMKAFFTKDKLPEVFVGEYKEESPPVYPITGIILIFAVVYLYKNKNRFRDIFYRSLLHPFGVFVDIRDLRILPFFQSLGITLVVAGTLSLMISGFLYSQRRNEVVDYFLTHFITNDSFKVSIIDLIWNPLGFIIWFTITFFFLMIFLSFFFFVIVKLLGSRTKFIQMFMLGAWSSTHYFILVPVGMFFYQLMDIEGVSTILLLIVGIFIIWHIFRFFNGLKIVADLSSGKTFVVFFVVVVLLASLLFYYHNKQASFYYLTFLMNILESYKI